MAMNKNLSYFLQRITGTQTNQFRLLPQNSDSATAGSIVRFSIPSNTLWHVEATSLMFSATCANSGATAGARLPPTEMLIDRYTVEAGGILIGSGHTLYGVLCQAKKALSQKKTDSVLTHPEMVRQKSYVDGSVIATTGNEVYPDANGQTQFAVNSWEGFLGSVSPGCVDTSLMPDIVLSFYLAGNEVLSSVAGITMSGTTDGSQPVVALTNNVDHAGAGGATYQLKNLRLIVEVLSLGSSVYDELVQRRIASQGFIELMYKSYQVHQDSHTGSSKFQTSTQSLDRVWIVHRAADHATQGGLVPVKGYKRSGAFASYRPVANASLDTTPRAFNVDVGVPQYDATMGTSAEKYKGKSFDFSRNGTAGATHHLMLNGSMTPQFMATSQEMYQISRNAVEEKLSYPESNLTLDQYLNNSFVLCFRFNLPGSEKENTISGIDTREINMACDYRTTGITAGTNVVIWTEHTSTLRIGNSRQIEYIG